MPSRGRYTPDSPLPGLRTPGHTTRGSANPGSVAAEGSVAEVPTDATGRQVLEWFDVDRLGVGYIEVTDVGAGDTVALLLEEQGGGQSVHLAELDFATLAPGDVVPISAADNVVAGEEVQLVADVLTATGDGTTPAQFTAHVVGDDQTPSRGLELLSEGSA